MIAIACSVNPLAMRPLRPTLSESKPVNICRTPQTNGYTAATIPIWTSEKPAAAPIIGTSPQIMPSLRLLTRPAWQHEDMAGSRNDVTVKMCENFDARWVAPRALASASAWAWVSRTNNDRTKPAIATPIPIRNGAVLKPYDDASVAVAYAASATAMYPAASFNPIARPRLRGPTRSIFITMVIDQHRPWLTPSRTFAKTIQPQLGAHKRIRGTNSPIVHPARSSRLRPT